MHIKKSMNIKLNPCILPRRFLYNSSLRDQWNAVVSSTQRKEISRGPDKGRLEGANFMVKDNISTKGDDNSCGSNVLDGYKGAYDATVVKLLLEAGSTLIGRTNMDEFGMGSANIHSKYGPSRNPIYNNEDYITGGSSGGSAAAVGAGLCTFALGTDTGGSIRLPASNCGVVGFKPSYGRISRWGVIPYAQTLDTVGIIADNVSTIKEVFATIDKFDPKDPTCMSEDLRSKLLSKTINKEKFTIGIPAEILVSEISAEVRELWIDFLIKLQHKGHTIKAISVPSLEKSLSAYYTIASAEAASNLARYDGIRYGTIGSITKDFRNSISHNRSHAFGHEVQRRIILGNYSLSSISGNHYIKAAEIRSQISSGFNKIFNFPNLVLNEEKETAHDGCDIIICPTSIGRPKRIDSYSKEEKTNFLNSYATDILTVPFSLAGLPSISIPFRQNSKIGSKFPMGFQIITQIGYDTSLLQLGEMIHASS